MSTLKSVITGAAGLVSQNLVPRLLKKGLSEIVAIDKHKENSNLLRDLHPSIRVVGADLAIGGGWEEELASCDALVIGHVQIGGLNPAKFVRDNVQPTKRLLAAAARHRVPYASISRRRSSIRSS